MNRRTLLAALALPTLLAACATPDPAGSYLLGIGSPVRGAALNAPNLFGDLSRWQGQPGGAALAVVQIEYLAEALAEDPYWSTRTSPTVVMQMQWARREVRDHLGIHGGAPPEAVMGALRQAAEALDRGSRAAAEAALQGPAFSRGGAETLRLLASMPRLPRSAEAAGAVNAEMARQDNLRNN
ncbi:hypothetical protein QMO56_20720 [Roseomonas sp. E05]|uniref:hypothetical protein n=1 Tax=Roseomonas sp. E05 TaxID=3046310 RepID=UPI0024BAE55F|nr:hypothetical protein [Roseomonas sp. E05]MDJ0390539.1 hypothetical protein [Roseomonas sp. E05]